MQTDISRIRGMSVQNVMSREVVTIDAEMRLRSAWISLMENNISGAPVVDEEGLLIGIVSIKDIHEAIFENFNKAKALQKGNMQPDDGDESGCNETKELTMALNALFDSRVSDILPASQYVERLGPLDSLERAIKLMADKSVNRLPVVKEDRVVGIITRQDVIMVLSGRSRR